MIGSMRKREPQASEPVAQRQDAMQLIALVRECLLAGIARRACVVHLSRLGIDRLRPHHVRLARAALEPLAHADRARLFTLPNQSLVTVWRGDAKVAVATSKAAIMHLFADGDAGKIAPDMVWEELDIPGAAERLLAMAKALLDPATTSTPPAASGLPLDPASLSALEAQLANADVARFARRHPVCSRLADGSFRLRWEKRTLCIDELAESLTPDHAPEADPWLFLRLTRTLDRRMLALLAAPGKLTGARPFAINLNVSSILGPNFLRFDTALPAALRGQVTLDLLPADVLADPSAFLFARDFARARGYRLSLRSITAELLPVFPLARLGLDLLQLKWSAQLSTFDGMAALADVSKIMLSHADTPAAIAWGSAFGIELFQGYLAAEPAPHATLAR